MVTASYLYDNTKVVTFVLSDIWTQSTDSTALSSSPHSPCEQHDAYDEAHHTKRVAGTEQTMVVEQGGYLLLRPFPCRRGKAKHGSENTTPTRI